jgi:spoIIIJ-associated protein
MGFFNRTKRVAAETSKPEITEKKEPRVFVKDAEKRREKKEIAINYITNIVKAMGLNPDLSAVDDEKGVVITVNDDGIIGNNGDVIDAIQYLTSTIVNRRESDFYRISIDASGYREKRENVLAELVTKFSENVVKTGISAAMLPMNAYERRIVHSKISDIEGVYSKSVGEEPNRKVVIYPVNKKAPQPIQTRRTPQAHKHTEPRKPAQKREPREYVPKPIKPIDIGTSFERDFFKNQGEK